MELPASEMGWLREEQVVGGPGAQLQARGLDAL